MGSSVSVGLVYALHGFLGQASDWNSVKDRLFSASEDEISFLAEDLFSYDGFGIENFGSRFELLEKRIAEKSLHPKKKVFVGYSLGGRIGLHILESAPQLFDHFIFISTNPGLPTASEIERVARKKMDLEWSVKINSENWLNFIEEWNKLPVFAGSGLEPKRELKNFDLGKLRCALAKWSLGDQADFSNLIGRHKKKITWIVGDRDLKYVSIAETLKENQFLDQYLTVKSSHRVWLDNPEEVSKIIAKLLV